MKSPVGSISYFCKVLLLPDVHIRSCHHCGATVQANKAKLPRALSRAEQQPLQTSRCCSPHPGHDSKGDFSCNQRSLNSLTHLSTPLSTHRGDHGFSGEDRVCLPAQLGSFPRMLQLHGTSWSSSASQFHSAKAMWTWPVCSHTCVHPVPTGNRWLCLQACSSIYLILSFTHYLMFGEEFTHSSASDFSQGFHRWTFADQHLTL